VSNVNTIWQCEVEVLTIWWWWW